MHVDADFDGRGERVLGGGCYGQVRHSGHYEVKSRETDEKADTVDLGGMTEGR